MEKVTVVCWKWQAYAGYRSTFTAEHVNVFARMVNRNCSGPHEVVCITDDPEGITEVDRIIPLWDDYSDIPSPMDRPNRQQHNPSCYRRLRMFAPDTADWLGNRVLSLDLDIVIRNDIYPLTQKPYDFAIWGDTNPRTTYNGGVILFTAGARPQLLTEFADDPQAAIQRGRALGQFGSDQAWIGACLGPNEHKLGTSDGIYSFRNHCQKGVVLPSTTTMVLFHGAYDPWGAEAQKIDWVRTHWC